MNLMVDMVKGLLLFIILLFPVFAQAATRFVIASVGATGCSQGGTNYNATTNTCGGGSSTIYIASSDANLKTAIEATGQGDTLFFRAGTYPRRVSGNTMAFASGTSFANAPTFKSYSGETVTFTSPGGLTIFELGAGSLAPSGRYQIWDGFVVDGSDVCNGQSNIGVSGDHIRLINVETKNNSANCPGGDRGAGVFVSGDDHEMQYIHSHHNSFGATSLGGNMAPYGFYMYIGTRNLVEHSSIHDNGGYGIHGFSSTGGINNHTYRYNTVYNNGAAVDGGAGILISNGSGNAAYWNVVYNNWIGLSVGYSCTDCLFYNNTSYGNRAFGLQISSNTGTGLQVKNNIFSSNSILNVNNDGSPTVTYATNLCSSAGTGCAIVESAATTFVNPGSNFTLKTGSQAIDHGTTNIALGITIPACSGGITTSCYNGVSPDIGALETGVPTVAGGPPTLTPNLTTVAAGMAILVTVDDDDVNERTEDPGDWVAIFVPGADAATVPAINWFYMNGTKTAPASAISDAVIAFTAPSTPGAYEFRFYRNNSTADVDRLATAPFTVVAPGIVMKFNISSLKIGPSVTWKIGTP